MGLLKTLGSWLGTADCETPVLRPGRNEACWCGSGMKYKKCHLESDAREDSKKSSVSCGST